MDAERCIADHRPNYRGAPTVKFTTLHTLVLASATVFAAPPAGAQQTDQAELAKQTLNPVAALISVPIKYDYNTNIGPSEQGNQSVLTIQPVIPMSISADWNLISRSIIPGINQHNVRPGAGTPDGLGDVESGPGRGGGIGDITQQFYFSPKKPTDSGWIWGLGPQFLLPTGGNKLTAGKWGAGPTFVALKQESGWTYGALLNHILSLSNDSTKGDYSTSYVQPFLAYTTKTFTPASINAESTNTC